MMRQWAGHEELWVNRLCARKLQCWELEKAINIQLHGWVIKAEIKRFTEARRGLRRGALWS